MTADPVYVPSLESLRRHPVPDWYQDAKLGIFIHWSLSSVPGFAQRDRDIGELARERFDDFARWSPYTEWYENALRFPDSPAARYHRARYGKRPYASFQADWEAALEHWDPDSWAEHFASAGARYVVLVTKHHDGYCLWPSRVANPRRSGWYSARDVVGELARALRRRGLRFGVYYSGGIDWSFEPRPVRNLLELVASTPGGAYPAYAEAQVRELVDRYAPDVLWNDICWPTSASALYRLFADYYAAVPEGLVNDRWLTPGLLLRSLKLRPLRALAHALLRRHVRRHGLDPAPPRPPHCDVRTPEYAVFPDIRREKWECVRGMDKSFGFNRLSREEDFIGHQELVHGLIDIVAKNGNLLLNVGPRGEDASIPEPQLRRLAWLGDWLATHREAIYGTRPWQRAEGRTAEGHPVRFTCSESTLYALVLADVSAGSLTLQSVPAAPGAEIRCLGRGPVRWQRDGADLRLELPPGPPSGPALGLRIPRL